MYIFLYKRIQGSDFSWYVLDNDPYGWLRLSKECDELYEELHVCVKHGLESREVPHEFMKDLRIKNLTDLDNLYVYDVKRETLQSYTSSNVVFSGPITNYSFY